jgi:hypothetical protein
MTTLFKYPEETRTYVFDFSTQVEVAAGDSLSSGAAVTATCVSGTGTLTIGSPSIVSDTVQCTIAGGDLNDKHDVLCVVTTAAGSIIAQKGILSIVRK